LRQAQNKLAFTVMGPTGADGDDVRKKAVTDALTSIDSSSTKKILFHPGIGDDGNPLSGDMTDVTITQVTSRKLKFKLAVRASDTDDLEAGDIVGTASATKCPVNVTFSITGGYKYNGHAASGNQVLVLRTDPAGDVAATVCHELGHSMGLAVMPLATGAAMPTPPGLDVPKHVDNGGTYFRNKSSAPYTNGFRAIQQGPHCCDGMPGGKKSDPKFNNFSPSSDICIMWGSGTSGDIRKKYCDTCLAVLQARDLRNVRQVWAGSTQG
jgi:hypothetical protein